MEKKYGPEHVRRQHGTRRLAVTAGSYRHIQVSEAANGLRLYEEMARLRALFEEHRRRLNGLANTIVELGRRVASVERRDAFVGNGPRLTRG